MKKIKRAVMSSILLHAILFSSLLANGINRSNGSNKNSPPKINNNIIEKQLNEVEFIDILDTKNIVAIKKNKPIKSNHMKRNCNSFFGGIGIVQYQGVIAEVIKGYPADLNGLKVGMKIISDTKDIIGEIGTEVTLVIMMDNERQVITMIRDKVCTEDI